MLYLKEKRKNQNFALIIDYI